MSYTGRVDNIKIEETSKGVVISTQEPGWGGAHEPRYHTSSVTIPTGSIDNLIASLRDVQSAKRNEW